MASPARGTLGNCPCVIVGAGAAGLFAALGAARRGARPIVLEALDRVGARLLASGGGRCNVTIDDDRDAVIARFGRQGRFLGPALETLDPQGIRDLLAGLGVATVREPTGRVYPRQGGAAAVRSALVAEARRLGTDIRTGWAVRSLRIEAGRVVGVEGDRGRLDASAVVLACGGRSYPELGGSPIGYDLARQAGHEVTDLLPALVGLVTAEDWPPQCAGVSIQRVRAWIDLPRRRDRQRAGEMLFTHRGVSGPALLDLSGDVAEALARHGSVPLRLDLLPEGTGVGRAGRGALPPAKRWAGQLERWRQDHPSRPLRTLLSQALPRSLAEQLLSLADLCPTGRAAELSNSGLRRLSEILAAVPLTIDATEGWDKAMVTRGGVRLKEVEPKTLASRRAEGLWLAGEMLDLDGPCGGYNLTWALASGYLAGRSAADACAP